MGQGFSQMHLLVSLAQIEREQWIRSNDDGVTTEIGFP
jgi:hypothetical protein